MPWDNIKCVNGYPTPFTDTDAQALVNAADFSQSVYVNTSAQQGRTRQAYTYVTFGGFRLCVVGHIHPVTGQPPVAGNAFIPGWLGDAGNGWDMTTPAAAVVVIDGLPDGGTFPGPDRYPQPVP